jgi:hypothetical protein
VPDGTYKDFEYCFKQLYFPPEDDTLWSVGYSTDTLYYDFLYDGPLPPGNELLLVGGYLIKKKMIPIGELPLYTIKPFHYLTKIEKATCVITNEGVTSDEI